MSKGRASARYLRPRYALLKIVFCILYDVPRRVEIWILSHDICNDFFAVVFIVDDIIGIAIPLSELSTFIIWKPLLMRLLCLITTGAMKSNLVEIDFILTPQKTLNVGRCKSLSWRSVTAELTRAAECSREFRVNPISQRRIGYQFKLALISLIYITTIWIG